MRKVINNLLYDTTKSRHIASVEFNGRRSSKVRGGWYGGNDGGRYEAIPQRQDEDATIDALGNDVFQCLYKTAKGNFFKFIHSHGQDHKTINGILNPVDRIGAKLWLEKHDLIDELLVEFGEEIEEA